MKKTLSLFLMIVFMFALWGCEHQHKYSERVVDPTCEEKGYTSYNLAYKSSMPLTTLTHMLDGSSTNPSLYNIIKICDGLDMTLAEFFDTEEFENAIIESRDEK